MRKIFLISDTHFNHVNIIKYCNRPFKDVEEMNRILIENWNNTVKDNDIVYFLGDFNLSRNKNKVAREIMSNLNGEIIFIRGNHDKFGEKFKIIEYKGYKFMLIHNPDSSYTLNFDGWIIHGHHHANDLDNYPFINPKTKRINVSVEVINYKPVNIDLIIKLIEKGEVVKKIL
ncbi:metallophosphoesterase [Methanocaldococcus indicus]|uniref:metallophosphoesterase n=1 Tax=Methanocaldococcus indicus TaxID=213231 RepID=UPI003C6DA4C5